MFKFTKNFWIPLGVGAGTLAVGAGTAVGIILPKALQAKAALENWIPNGGAANSLKGKNKINYVALGDSETAGYIGLLGEDYLSYADFLAGSLKTAGKLGKYSNLALSGERLSDFKKDIFQSPDKVRELHDADLITLTLGANDVLAYMKILNIPFGQALGFIGDPEKIETIAEDRGITKYDRIEKKYVIQKSEDISDSNLKAKVKLAEDKLNTLKPYWHNEASRSGAANRKKIFDGHNPNLGISKKDSAELFTETIDKLSKILTGTPQALLNIDKDWYPKIFDLIKREYVTLIRDLHKAAPKAEIRVLGHAFPFSSFPKPVIQNNKESLQGDSLSDGFSKMLEAIKEGAEKNLDGKSSFVKFQNINDFPTFKKHLKPLQPTVDLADKNVFKTWVENNPMPNITDIHPSVYGHDLIAEDLYKDIASEMGNITNIKDTTQHSNLDASSPWSRKDKLDLNDDDKLTKFYDSSKTIYGFATMGNSISKQETIKPIIKGLLDYMKKPSKDGSKELVGNILYEILPFETKKFIFPLIYKSLQDSMLGLLYTQNIDDPEVLNDFLSHKDKFGPPVSMGILGLANEIKKDPTEKEKYINQFGEGMINLISIKDNITNLVNSTKIITKQLEDGIKSKDVSNEDQWTLAQVGLAKLFKELFVISSALTLPKQQTTS